MQSVRLDFVPHAGLPANIQRILLIPAVRLHQDGLQMEAYTNHLEGTLTFLKAIVLGAAFPR
jgi:hypothetical protein